MELKPEARARILESLELCFSPQCKAHDRIVAAILKLEKEAFAAGLKAAKGGWEVVKHICPKCEALPAPTGDFEGAWLDCGTQTLWLRCGGCGSRWGPFGTDEEAHAFWEAAHAQTQQPT